MKSALVIISVTLAGCAMYPVDNTPPQVLAREAAARREAEEKEKEAATKAHEEAKLLCSVGIPDEPFKLGYTEDKLNYKFTSRNKRKCGDTVSYAPSVGLKVSLETSDSKPIASGVTDSEGQVELIIPDGVGLPALAVFRVQQDKPAFKFEKNDVNLGLSDPFHERDAINTAFKKIDEVSRIFDKHSVDEIKKNRQVALALMDPLLQMFKYRKSSRAAISNKADAFLDQNRPKVSTLGEIANEIQANADAERQKNLVVWKKQASAYVLSQTNNPAAAKILSIEAQEDPVFYGEQYVVVVQGVNSFAATVVQTIVVEHFVGVGFKLGSDNFNPFGVFRRDARPSWIK